MVFGKTLDSFEEIIENVDDLLSKLTDEEIRELSAELDPESSLIPPSERCPVQTTKKPSGPFDHEKLSRFLAEKALSDPDWSEAVPFERKNHGRTFEKKTCTPVPENEIADPEFVVELDEGIYESLRNATNEELLDLKSILDLVNLPNNFNARSTLTPVSTDLVTPKICSKISEELSNVTDIEESISRLSNNDSKLTVLNLNNIKDLDDEILTRLCTALSQNTILEELHMAATDLNSTKLQPLLKVLKENNSIRVLNLESNFLTGRDILKLLEAISIPNNNVSHLRLANQFHSTLGSRVEREIMKLVVANPRITKFGFYFHTLEVRIGVDNHLCKAIAANRVKRNA